MFVCNKLLDQGWSGADIAKVSTTKPELELRCVKRSTTYLAANDFIIISWERCVVDQLDHEVVQYNQQILLKCSGTGGLSFRSWILADAQLAYKKE